MIFVDLYFFAHSLSGASLDSLALSKCQLKSRENLIDNHKNFGKTYENEMPLPH